MDIIQYREDYLRLADLTEYQFARFIGGWDKWQLMLKDENIQPIIANWRAELSAKLASEALGRILEAAKGETRDALGANKYIYEVLVKEEKNVGRPSREAISKEASRLVEDDRIREEAYRRIFKDAIQES